MICCSNCFRDPEIRLAIEGIGHLGNCPICGSRNTWIYDSDKDFESSRFEEMLASVIEIYKPDDLLDDAVPYKARKPLEIQLSEDWNIFNLNDTGLKKIVYPFIENSLELDHRLTFQNCAIPQMFDENYMDDHSIMRSYSWNDFKHYLRNENRFHSRHINLEMLEETLKIFRLYIPDGEKFYRARLAVDGKGFARKDMGAPPADLATAGRANSKGVSCLYLSNSRDVVVKEIRAGAFDYVTIGTFKLRHGIKVLDLSSITHNSPFYRSTDKVEFCINEKHLRGMAEDLAKPMSSHDSELEYLPTQYIIAFAKYLGYDGVKYISTFDETAYNLALFDVDVCKCVYHRTYQIENLEYSYR